MNAAIVDHEAKHIRDVEAIVEEFRKSWKIPISPTEEKTRIAQTKEVCGKDRQEGIAKAEAEAKQSAMAEQIRLERKIEEVGKQFHASPEGNPDIPDCTNCKACAVNKWRGEGTIQAEFNAEFNTDTRDPPFPFLVWRSASSGTFTITFEIQALQAFIDSFYPPNTEENAQEDGTSQGEETEALTAEEERELSQQGVISGEGTATVTGTGEYKQLDAPHRARAPELVVHCTDRWQATVPLAVVGTKEGNTLRLSFSAKRDGAGAQLDTLSHSCTGPGAKAFGAGAAWTKSFTRFWEDVSSLEVPAEDGATREGVDESSFPPGTKSKVLWSIRLKALPPEEGGSLPVSEGTDHSAPELSGPLLSDH